MDLEDFTGNEPGFQAEQQRPSRNWEGKEKGHNRRYTKLGESLNTRDGERLKLVYN